MAHVFYEAKKFFFFLFCFGGWQDDSHFYSLQNTIPVKMMQNLRSYDVGQPTLTPRCSAKPRHNTWSQSSMTHWPVLFIVTSCVVTVRTTDHVAQYANEQQAAQDYCAVRMIATKMAASTELWGAMFTCDTCPFYWIKLVFDWWYHRVLPTEWLSTVGHVNYGKHSSDLVAFSPIHWCDRKFAGSCGSPWVFH